ncbi:hypothetical protein EC917_1551 [Bacillus thuringiensis]|uniref:Uncharacterized protein n=1 Tax=Bacillus thuringiensis TaxID=1428 RepID=A0A4R4ATY0_BACTU|nr:hypothetical protein [Bacillus thuringiensis]TCW42851.1 hypothetical protein EC917_1551 [Bacillus thuringiensis]TCW43357.1 hypothetical protein EC910_1541 [Bacillus thuringiensis]
MEKKILFILSMVFTCSGVVLFWFWALKSALITVRWDIISDKLFENLVFALIFTALFSWVQLVLTLFLLRTK